MKYKYIDIIGLNEYFQPVYDILNEQTGYWKQFIPNEKFYEILRTTIDSITSTDPKKRKSIWMQGTYGTGKSHSISVIRHLLCDRKDEINDYLENSLKHKQLKERIKTFRKKGRIFPIILKGISGITDNRSFSLEIEKATENALKREHVDIAVESSFEKIIISIKNDTFLNWDELIKENRELSIYIKDRNDLIRKLQKRDLKILRIVENILSERGWHRSHERIEQYLLDLLKRFTKEGIASGIIIFWDEFTPLLELEKNSQILSEIQNIAELSFKNNIFLFVVSHRMPTQAKNLKQEDIEKILGRFHYKDYSMETITTYHILSAAIKIKDKEKYDEIKKILVDQQDNFQILVDRIVGDEGKTVKDVVYNFLKGELKHLNEHKEDTESKA